MRRVKTFSLVIGGIQRIICASRIYRVVISVDFMYNTSCFFKYITLDVVC